MQPGWEGIVRTLIVSVLAFVGLVLFMRISVSARWPS